jgi:hypothetical protein
MRSTPELREQSGMYDLLAPPSTRQKHRDRSQLRTRLDAAPLTCCGEERRDSNKADHSVKKNLSEKKIDQIPSKMEGVLSEIMCGSRTETTEARALSHRDQTLPKAH